MIFVPSEQLKPGMVLAKEVNISKGNNFKFVLLTNGQMLSDAYINKIKSYDIYGAYIQNDGFEDLNVKPILNDEIKNKTIKSIKKIFNNTEKGIRKVGPAEINEISKIVDELISELNTKKDLSYNLGEFKNHDNYTYTHCLSVSLLSILTGISLGLSKKMLHDLGMSALLHDIGKMVIPLEIINKPSKLSKEEFNIMKEHPLNGVKQLQNLVSNDILQGIETHHENLDGSGYPYGKKEKDISLYGKIISICDVYDALTSRRAYRNPCIPSEAIEYLMGCVGSKFDYEIMTIFLKNITAYPVGTLVRLSNGKTCVVVKNYKENIMRPLVRVIHSNNTAGENIDLYNDLNYLNVTIVSK